MFALLFWQLVRTFLGFIDNHIKDAWIAKTFQIFKLRLLASITHCVCRSVKNFLDSYTSSYWQAANSYTPTYLGCHSLNCRAYITDVHYYSTDVHYQTIAVQMNTITVQKYTITVQLYTIDVQMYTITVHMYTFHYIQNICTVQMCTLDVQMYTINIQI